MRKLFLIFLLTALPLHSQAGEMEFDLFGTFSAGYRGAGIENGEELKTQESKGSVYLAAKVYLLTANINYTENDRMLFLGVGYRHQFNGTRGLILSPIGYKTPIGPILMMDMFTDGPEHGNGFGISLGFNL